MDMESIVRVVESHAEKLAMKWLERVRKEEDMHGYLHQPEGRLLQHVQRAYEEIGACLDDPESPIIRDHFLDTGRTRKEHCVPLVQVIRAIQLARTVLWDYVHELGIFDSSLNLYRGLNLYRNIVRAFDKAQFYAVKGYTEEG